MKISGGESRRRTFSRKLRDGVRPPLARLRQSVFSMLGDRVEGAHVLDLFAGSGTFAFEALSRGARSAVLVESDPRIARELDGAVEELGLRARCRVVRSDALGQSLPGRLRVLRDEVPWTMAAFDIVFVDPPFALCREAAGAEKLARRVDELLGGDLVAERGVVVFRQPADVDAIVAREPASVRSFGKSVVSFLEPRGAAEEDGGDR